VLQLIERETAHAKAGQPARILAKMNALVDRETIHALYAASAAGVQVELLVRGICCLRPGLPGTSDRIRVVSVIGRFLEHSRVWCFHNDGAPEFYLTSADWMPRNFNRRVEVAVPVEDPALHPRLLSLLETSLADNRQAWELSADGAYARRYPGDAAEVATQKLMLKESWGLGTRLRGERPADAFG
jgi:polyphosphate kinase